MYCGHGDSDTDLLGPRREATPLSQHWIKVKKLRPDAHMPELGTPGAAGADLYACIDADGAGIHPGSVMKIGTGIAVEIPPGYFGAIFARSGLSTKKGLRPTNCVGVIDSDYRGEIIVALRNDTRYAQVISKGERIAQLVILPCVSPIFVEAEELSDTERGEGGFGSTGAK